MRRPLSWLLNTVYVTALLAAMPAMLWSAWKHGKRRTGWACKLWGQVPERAGSRPCIWVHAVSVGEVNLLAPLLARLAVARPEAEIWISTTTKTGYELAQKKYPEWTVFYCPFDFSWAVRRALARVRPDLLLLAELELWPHLITLAKERGTRVAVVNGRLSDRSFRGYSRIGGLLRPVLRQLDLVTAQDDETASRFTGLGAERQRVHVTGSLKVDGVLTDRNNPRSCEFRELAGFSANDRVWLAGSTQNPEEEIVLRVFEQLQSDHPQLRLVVVPRHPERFGEVERLITRRGYSCRRRSRLSPGQPLQAGEMLLVDTVGELAAWWGTADVGFVGGSFGDRGGQNMLEPAALGVATCFGPNTRNFRDIVTRLLAEEAACEVRDEQALSEFVHLALTDDEFAQRLAENAQNWVRQHQGAAATTITLVEQLMRHDVNSVRAA